jgi:hypothetical protein
MKPYHLMNTQEMAEAQRTDPVAYKAMIDELDKTPVAFDSNGQVKYKNGVLIAGTVATKFTNGQLQ